MQSKAACSRTTIGPIMVPVALKYINMYAKEKNLITPPQMLTVYLCLVLVRVYLYYCQLYLLHSLTQNRYIKGTCQHQMWQISLHGQKAGHKIHSKEEGRWIC